MPDGFLQVGSLQTNGESIGNLASVTEAERKIGDAISLARPKRLINGPHINIARV